MSVVPVSSITLTLLLPQRLCLDLDRIDDAAAKCDRECSTQRGPSDEHEVGPAA
jgi:hypothetical protein